MPSPPSCASTPPMARAADTKASCTASSASASHDLTQPRASDRRSPAALRRRRVPRRGHGGLGDAERHPPRAPPDARDGAPVHRPAPRAVPDRHPAARHRGDGHRGDRALDRLDPERRQDPAAPGAAGAQDAAGTGARPLGARARRRFGPGRRRPGPAPRMTRVRARRSVSTIFFVNGAVLASWVPHIPAVKAAHGLGDGALGLVLLSMAAGSVLALTLAGWLVGRIGSRATTSMAAIALCLTLPLPILSPAVPLLALSLVLVGASNAILDVAMNAQAVLVEREYGRPIMSSFHGLFSLGGLAGAALAGLAIGLGVPPACHVVASAAVALLAVGRALRWLVPSDVADASASPVFARPSGVLFGLGVL